MKDNTELKELRDSIKEEIKKIHFAFLGCDYKFLVKFDKGLSFSNDEFRKNPKVWNTGNCRITEIMFIEELIDDILSRQLVDEMFSRVGTDNLGTSKTSYSNSDAKILYHMQKLADYYKSMKRMLLLINSLNNDNKKHVLFCNMILGVSVQELAKQLNKQVRTINQYITSAINDICEKRALGLDEN